MADEQPAPEPTPTAPSSLPAGSTYVGKVKNSKDPSRNGLPVYYVPGRGNVVYQDTTLLRGPESTQRVSNLNLPPLAEKMTLRAPNEAERSDAKRRELFAKVSDWFKPAQIITGVTPEQALREPQDPLVRSIPGVAATAASVALGPEVKLLPRALATAGAAGAGRFGAGMFSGESAMEAAKGATGEALIQGGIEAVPGLPRGIGRIWAQKGLNNEARIASKELGRRITNREVFEWASRNGIDMTVPEAAEKAMAKALQDVFESSLFASTRASSRWTKSHAAAEEVIDRSRIILGGASANMTNAEIGEALKGNLDPMWKRTQNYFKEKYASVWKIDPTALVSIPKEEKASLGQEGVDLVTRARNAPTLKESLNPAIQKIGAFLRTQDRIPLPEAHEIRSEMWSQYREAMKRDDVSSQTKKAMKDVAEAYDRAIEKSISGTQLAELKSLDKEYKGMLKDFESADIEGIKRRKAGNIGRWLASVETDTVTARDFAKVIEKWGKDPKQRDAIRVAYLNAILQDPDVIGGSGIPSIATAVRKQGVEKVRTIFGNDVRGKVAFEDLVMLGDVERRVRGLTKDEYKPVHAGLRTAWSAMELITGSLAALQGVTGVGNEDKRISRGRNFAIAGLGVEAALSAILFNRNATRALMLGLNQAPYSTSHAISNATRALMLAFQEKGNREQAQKNIAIVPPAE